MERLGKMFAAHPDPVTSNGDAAHGCVAAATECALVCIVCADACLGEADVKAQVKCIRLNLDCAAVCRLTAELLARPSRRDEPALRAQLDACIRICTACADECGRHGAMGMEHCAVCADACRACASACQKMAASLVP